MHPTKKKVSNNWLHCINNIFACQHIFTKFDKSLKKLEIKKTFSNKELKNINRTHEKIYLIGLADEKKIYN